MPLVSSSWASANAGASKANVTTSGFIRRNPATALAGTWVSRLLCSPRSSQVRCLQEWLVRARRRWPAHNWHRRRWIGGVSRRQSRLNDDIDGGELIGLKAEPAHAIIA